jgi:L-lactate dehydrogenase complex protein LldG
MTADLGITGAGYGLADTGTLVLLASEVEGRLASLLPPVHLAVITADQIVADLTELFFRLTQPPSSCLTFITGPSRTADIELTLTVGVHGPKELHVVVLMNGK